MTVWSDRDALVLSAIATSESDLLRQGFLQIGHGRAGEELGLELDDALIHDSLLALADADYIDGHLQYEGGNGAHFTHLAITGSGLQALGEWPLFDAATSPETIALLLERLAPEAPSEEESENMRRAADYLRSIAPAVFRALVTGAVAQGVRLLVPGI